MGALAILAVVIAGAEPVRLVAPSPPQPWTEALVQELARAGLIIQTEAEGSDGLVVGTQALEGETRVLQVRVVSPTGTPLASSTVSAPTDEAAIEAAKPLAQSLVEQLRRRFEMGRVPDEGFKLLKRHSLWPGLLGGLSGAAGIAMVSIGVNAESNIRSGAVTYPTQAELDAATHGARTLAVTGWVFVGVGLALAVAAIAIVVFGEGR